MRERTVRRIVARIVVTATLAAGALIVTAAAANALPMPNLMGN